MSAFALALVVVVPLLAGVTPQVPAVAAVPATGIDPTLALPKLSLTVTKTKTNTGTHVRLKNLGKAPVVVVVPGDGSEAGWRTPILTWSFVPLDAQAKKSAASPAKPEGRCGMMNPISAAEVQAIAPGKELALSSWVNDPRPPGPGKWSATLTWQNDPTKGQKGSDIADEEAARAVAASDAFTVVAEPVVVTGS